MKFIHLLPALIDSPRQRRLYDVYKNVDITAVVCDSRAAVPGCLFVALEGAATDGHKFVANAVNAGAVAVLTERPVAVPRSILRFVLPDARRRLARLAANFHGEPTRRLHVTGVTGTNGKTTTTYRLRSILEAAGHGTGLIGTISYQIGQRNIPANNTTPDGLFIQRLFADMLEEGNTHAVMEVSSHALCMDRVSDVNFKTAVFTNLSNREHLDYHKTLENYRDAKARLFEMLPADGCAVTNADDPVGAHMASRANCRRLSFGLHNTADVTAKIIRADMNGTVYRLSTPDGSADVHSALIGDFNLMNDLAATAAAVGADIPLHSIVGGLESKQQVPGRLEKVAAPDFFPLVDYAHNEGALDSVLATIRRLATRRLIVVFGCGGDRDRTKRPAMGAVAEKYCDLIFLTADNSRSEKTEDIVSEIEAGMSGKRPRQVHYDREVAIQAAVNAAQPGDVLLVAGKGHETYQILGAVKAPFDDREVLRDAIAARTGSRSAKSEAKSCKQ